MTSSTFHAPEMPVLTTKLSVIPRACSCILKCLASRQHQSSWLLIITEVAQAFRLVFTVSLSEGQSKTQGTCQVLKRSRLYYCGESLYKEDWRKLLALVFDIVSTVSYKMNRIGTYNSVLTSKWTSIGYSLKLTLLHEPHSFSCKKIMWFIS